MADLKFSKKADEIANLYRSALYMAQGNIELALQFLKKSPKNRLVKLSMKELGSRSKQKYWAEKILDSYLILKNKVF